MTFPYAAKCLWNSRVFLSMFFWVEPGIRVPDIHNIVCEVTLKFRTFVWMMDADLVYSYEISFVGYCGFCSPLTLIHHRFSRHCFYTQKIYTTLAWNKSQAKLGFVSTAKTNNSEKFLFARNFFGKKRKEINQMSKTRVECEFLNENWEMKIIWEWKWWNFVLLISRMKRMIFGLILLNLMLEMLCNGENISRISIIMSEKNIVQHFLSLKEQFVGKIDLLHGLKSIYPSTRYREMKSVVPYKWE